MKKVVSLFCLLPVLAFADVTPEQKPEVDHLIDYVSHSSCKFKRNFSYHTAKEAVEHIQKKYDYFRDKIKTTDDFIRLSATKSLLTGKLYKVKCGEDDLIATKDWLNAELKVFRETQAKNKLNEPPHE